MHADYYCTVGRFHKLNRQKTCQKHVRGRIKIYVCARAPLTSGRCFSVSPDVVPCVLNQVRTAVVFVIAATITKNFREVLYVLAVVQ